MTNYIIECKNKDALANNPNLKFGDYDTLIQDKIMLEEGDIVQLKSAFIDTQATSSQKIIIANDLSLTLGHYNYIINHFGTNTVSTSFSRFGTPNPDILDNVVVDGSPYYVCKKGGQTANIRVMNSLFFSAYSNLNPNYGNLLIFINFTDVDGNKQSIKRYLRSESSTFLNLKLEFSAVFDSTQPFNVSANFPTDQGTGGNGFILGGSGAVASGGGRLSAPHINNTKILGYGTTAGFPNDNVWSQDISSFPHYNIVSFETTAKISAGNYAPDDLCEVINRQLSSLGNNISGEDLLNSQALISIETGSTFEFCKCAKYDGGQEITPTANDYRYKYGSNGGDANYNGVYVGASNLVLAFEPNTQKFFWEYLHQPYIQNNSEATGWGRFTNLNNDSVVQQLDRAGGIVLNSLTATEDNTGASTDFWSQQMGFQTDPTKPNCILKNPVIQLNGSAPTDERQSVFVPVFEEDPQVGFQMTANFSGVPSGVQNTDKFMYQPFLGQVGQATDKFLSTSTKTTGIDGGTNVLALSDRMTFGYYLIEVKSNFQNNFITPDSNNANMMAIVSRYYVNDAYTSATTEDGITYVHDGEPALLSSFHIRILDADKNLATNIGRDSTVFLNVIKNPNPPSKKS